MDYQTRIEAIHRELGIPADYAQRFQLPLRAEAVELTSIGADVYGRPQQLVSGAAHNWQTMCSQAQRDKVLLLVISAFRSVDYQRGVITRKLATGKPMDEILKINAAPGYSEHHTGCALDLTTSGQMTLETGFETTEAFAWLTQHAQRFGFRLSYPRDNRHGIAYEPWHWACLDEP
ncbi:MAG: D-alanyl-D-alanine carboxypeptidase family protein [Gammaproteobacteria bacterium]|nr:D-alanyl-D-alanine carboxypeptidase family protein [Gammaproteobacteria bacterium]